jgi:hypothetical protein
MVLKIRPQSDSVFITWNQWFLLTKTENPPLFILTLQIQNSTLQYHIKAPDSTILQFQVELVWVSYLDISHVVSYV